MCGIVAFLQNSAVPLAAARAALASLEHRGPDAGGEWQDGDVYLGHRRLSIIDLHTGAQPMHSADGRYVLVFNGEIYNYRELRRDLQADGAVFRTASDTEVILEGYRRWGADVVVRLHGMFAFVIWDRVAQTAFGARDRLGIKPLCWAVKGETFIVASTLEPFRDLEGFDEFDAVAVRDLMTFDYIPAPRTIRRGVWKFPPGSRFEWRRGLREPRIDTYWTPPPADRTMTPPTEEELEDLLSRAVKRQMVSDVPLGVFLSGGIDSSLLVALMARHSAEPVRTYSVSFAEQQVDESPIAAAVARQFGTNHQVLRAEDIGAESLQQLVGALDEPFCDPALVPLFALSRLTRAHVKVALSGDGGDEVFGGYEKYLLRHAGGRQLPLASLMRRSLHSVRWRPRGMAHLYAHTMSSSERLRFAFSTYGDFPVFRKDLRQLFSRDFQDTAQPEHFFEPWDRVARKYGAAIDADVLMRTDLQTYLSENCLVKTDRATMLASLEVRVPFLDELVLERILPLHADEKIVGAELKALLRPLARRLLPEAVWNRPKHGFNVPVEVKLAGTWRPAVDDALSWGERNLAVFDYRYLRRLQRINVKERAVGLELWNPVMFLSWAMSQRARRRAA
jgi:asparagine synthase (glutamine-hydrolysing)